MAKVDKGKGRADEVSSHEVSQSVPVGGDEGRSCPHGRGRGRLRGCSQSHRPHKHVKSAAIVESKDDELSMTTQPPPKKSYNLLNPPSDYTILSMVDRCDQCVWCTVRKMTVLLVSNATRPSMGATCPRSMQNLDCGPMHQHDMEKIRSPLHQKIWSPLHHKHHNLSQPCDVQLGKEKLAAPFPWKSPQHPHNLSLDVPFWGPLRANTKVRHSIIFFLTTDFLNRNGCSGNPSS